MPPRQYISSYATLRVYGPRLAPTAVSEALRLPSDRSHFNNELRMARTKSGNVAVRGRYRSGLWAMSSKGWVQSNSPEPHIWWILEQVNPVALGLKALLEDGHSADIFCYCLTRSKHPPSITSECREAARSVGLAIELDVYCDELDERADTPKRDSRLDFE